MGEARSLTASRVAIPEAELGEVSIEHLESGIDPSIALPLDFARTSGDVITGYTEWAGTFKGAAVTLGWDWALDRGRMVLLDAEEIRTNILLVSEDGSPRPPERSREHLALWIETLPWRAAAREVARGKG